MPAIIGAHAAEPPSAIAQPIAELRLTNGTVFRNVTIVRYDREQVVLKSSAGTGPLSYTMIPEPLRSQMIADRDGIRNAQAAALAAPRTISGAVFITTRGAGAYRFSSTHVYAYQQEYMQQAADIVRLKRSDSRNIFDLPSLWINALDAMGAKPVGSATTDADGKYAMRLPDSKPVFIFCMAHREVIRDRVLTPEFITWVIPNAPDACELNGANHL